jgi:hypothetical protein
MTAGGLFPRHDAIETLIRVDGVLGLPYEVPLECESPREVDRIRPRQCVVET